jgi:hypothetical protein
MKLCSSNPVHIFRAHSSLNDVSRLQIIISAGIQNLSRESLLLQVFLGLAGAASRSAIQDNRRILVWNNAFGIGRQDFIVHRRATAVVPILACGPGHVRLQPLRVCQSQWCWGLSRRRQLLSVERAEGLDTVFVVELSEEGSHIVVCVDYLFNFYCVVRFMRL